MGISGDRYFIKNMKIFAMLAAAITARSHSEERAAAKWWQNAQVIHQFAAGNEGFYNVVHKMPKELFDPLFKFCDGNKDRLIDDSELANCSHMIEKFGMLADDELLYHFFGMFWPVVDINGDGTLDYDEFKTCLAGFVFVDARTAMDGLDTDKNGILDGSEIVQFSKAFQNAMSQEKLKKQQWAALKDAINIYANGFSDGLSKYQLALFELAAGNIRMYPNNWD